MTASNANNVRFMPKPEASVVIPAWNEKAHIGMLLSRMPKGYEVIVVDDGSTDNTAQVARTFGYEPIELGSNHGKGYACLEGAKAAKSDKIIFMDGDLQHDPGDLHKFTKALQKSDLVLGYRDFSAIPFHRRLSNWIANAVINYVARAKFRDVQCGFRAIKKSRLMELELSNSGYEFEIEMIIKACKQNMRISEVPISVAYHWISSHGRKIRVGSRMHPLKSIRQMAFLFECFVYHA